MAAKGKCPEDTKDADTATKDIPEEGTGPAAGTYWNIRNALDLIHSISLPCNVFNIFIFITLINRYIPIVILVIYVVTALFLKYVTYYGHI